MKRSQNLSEKSLAVHSMARDGTGAGYGWGALAKQPGALLLTLNEPEGRRAFTGGALRETTPSVEL